MGDILLTTCGLLRLLGKFRKRRSKEDSRICGTCRKPRDTPSLLLSADVHACSPLCPEGSALFPPWSHPPVSQVFGFTAFASLHRLRLAADFSMSLPVPVSVWVSHHFSLSSKVTSLSSFPSAIVRVPLLPCFVFFVILMI